MDQNFASLAYGNCRELTYVLIITKIFMWKVDFEKKNPVPAIDKFLLEFYDIAN